MSASMAVGLCAGNQGGRACGTVIFRLSSWFFYAGGARNFNDFLRAAGSMAGLLGVHARRFVFNSCGHLQALAHLWRALPFLLAHPRVFRPTSIFSCFPAIMDGEKLLGGDCASTYVFHKQCRSKTIFLQERRLSRLPGRGR